MTLFTIVCHDLLHVSKKKKLSQVTTNVFNDTAISKTLGLLTIWYLTKITLRIRACLILITTRFFTKALT